MVVFNPSPGVVADPLELFEYLGSYMSGRYSAVESHLIEKIAKRVKAGKDVTDLNMRLAGIRQLTDDTRAALSSIDNQQLANAIVTTAANDGIGAALAQVGYAQQLGAKFLPTAAQAVSAAFGGGITPAAALASSAIALDLKNSLDNVKARIIRNVPDIYQQTIARIQSERQLGAMTGRQAQRKAVTEFLGGGITGFVDKAGRNWSIGGYVEMASRTATNRAWMEANTSQYTDLGLNLVSVVRGIDACRYCAPWSGKILSLDGRTGDVEEINVLTGQPMTIHIDGTIDQARTSGWNHPNCRCTLAAVFPGMRLPKDDTTYDPQSEKDRERLRTLERRVRGDKLKQAAASGDDLEVARLGKRIRKTQDDIREHVKNTGQVRKRYREQLDYQVGNRNPPPLPKPRPVTPPSTPTPAAIEAPRATIAAATSPQEVADAFTAQHGIPTKGFDTPGLDLDRVKSAAGTLSKLLEAHPGVVYEFEIAPIRNTHVFAQFAHSRPKPGEKLTTARIQVSASKMKRTSKTDDMMKRSVDAGWFRAAEDVDAMQYVLTHEFGHALDGATAFTMSPYTIENALIKELGMKRASTESSAWQKANKSGYAATSRAEFVAEAFADVTLNPATASELNRRIVRELLRRYREERPA